jgi:PAS domain-containing protein
MHSSGVVLRSSEYPDYFAALADEETIAADDARSDPRMHELAGYLAPRGIGALLDAPIRTGLRLVGVLCHEHVGGTRAWTPTEVKDAAFLGSLASLTLELKSRAIREALLAATLESTGEGILACDDHRVLAFNRRFVEMWKLELESLRDVAAVRAHIARHTDPMSALTSHANELFIGIDGESVDILEPRRPRVRALEPAAARQQRDRRPRLVVSRHHRAAPRRDRTACQRGEDARPRDPRRPHRAVQPALHPRAAR